MLSRYGIFDWLKRRGDAPKSHPVAGPPSTVAVQVEVEAGVTREPVSDRLSVAERIACERNQPPLTRDLIRRFGSNGFIFNVRMWEARTRKGESCSYVPTDDYYRKRFDVLADTGVALRGRNIPLEVRLHALPLDVLREGATASGLGKIRSKVHGAALLAGSATIENWLAARYNVDDFFLLRPEAWSYQELELLWHACEEEAERRR